MFTIDFPPVMPLLSAIFYGITMKVADLLDEHGMKLFRGSAIVFGILWGFFGILLVLSDNTLANIIVAMNLAFIVRNRLDYLNHQIAASMIIINFMFSATIEIIPFVVFYSIFVIFGSLRDYVGDVLINKKKKTNRILKAYDLFMWYYPIPAFVYAILSGEWIIFWVFLLYTVAYDGTKYLYSRKKKTKTISYT